MEVEREEIIFWCLGSGSSSGWDRRAGGRGEGWHLAPLIGNGSGEKLVRLWLPGDGRSSGRIGAAESCACCCLC